MPDQDGGNSEKLWGGRFSEPTDREVEMFTQSISFDRALWRQDIKGSRAHAAMLLKVGLLAHEEERRIQEGLSRIEEEMTNGTFPYRDEYEDIHMNIEKRLFELVGTPAQKLHTARSRNDQVSLDLRLYVIDRSREMAGLLAEFIRVLIGQSRRMRDLILPGYTHLQQAQPISAGYYFMAHAERLLRDRQRFLDIDRRLNLSPLGSGALAGTTLPIDRDHVARSLGFSGVTGNGLDAVSDRDFVADFLHAAVMLSLHLSGWAEEWILWSTREFGFVRIPDRYMTGSSMMPQKRNPDVLELIRGKTGRVIGHYMGLATILKGLPLSYNRDLQEDKEHLFDAAETVRQSVTLFLRIAGESVLDKERLREALSGDELLATDMAEDLVREGVPFREAHAIVGRIVAYCERERRKLASLTDEELRTFSPAFPEQYAHVLTPENAVRRRNLPGGPAPEQVEVRIGEIERELDGR